MSLTQSMANGLLIGGMAIVFLLILGVVGALRGSRKTAPPLPTWVDAEGVDLEDRLRKITLTSLKPVEALATPALDDDDDDPLTAQTWPSTPKPVPSALKPPPRSLSDRMPEGSINPPEMPGPSLPPLEISPPTTGRLALPSSASSPATSPREITPPSLSPQKEALDPLAARFSSADASSDPAHSAPPSYTPPAPAQRRPELPGMASRLPGSDEPNVGRGMDDAEAGKTQAGQPSSSVRLGLPGSVANGFTVIPGADSAASKPMPASRPPSENGVKHDPFGALPTPRRMGLPGTVAPSSAQEGAAGTGPGVPDIRAILRGEAAPLASPADAAYGPMVRKPGSSTGSLSPGADEGLPLGAVPFDPNLLHVRMLTPVAKPPVRAADAPGSEHASSGPATYEDDEPSERVVNSGRLIDLDATRIVEDFDVPDTGFETHVFSTAELIENENEIPQFPTYSAHAAPTKTAPAGWPAADLDRGMAQDVGGAAPTLSHAQEEQAYRHMSELAALVDVTFVKLLALDGSVILSAGNENGGAGTESHIADLINIAGMEVQQLDLGDFSSITVEGQGTALLLSPVHDGTSLAVLLSNPARLGLLRRQVRKPISGLRALLVESSVS